ncbi:MAG: RsmB/NOP family class I SAM-dependent RNA methyltransferase [Notoacmeibacter sp.]|nr:RsmB/NOP family class I SAM-dependent RNA methyltransferase [Notoacmeibacter sp.]MCC0032015.1 RsmB/NOP family class I SAM-dependent RNA methyltransferase [Brucellaceae bacterium]
MRLGGRLAAAIEILDDMEARKRPVADAMRDWGLSHRFAGSGDRSAIGNIVYDALRFKASSSWRFGAENGRALAFGALMSGLGMLPEDIAAALEGDKFAPEPLSPEETALWQGRDITDAPDHVRAEVPEWCAPMLAEAFGDGWIGEAQALAARPPLDLRVNTLKATPEKVLKDLARSGASAWEGTGTALRIPAIEGAGRHPNVTAEPAFQKGWFEVQDCGSQVVASLGLPDRAAQVLDLCAGGGGKTLALAAALDNKGQVHAYDSDKTRLAPIFERLRRAGTRNVQVHAAGSDLSALEGKMDLVLADAPCTGSGTWRRRPDTKWRLSEAALQERLAQQAGVLDDAARFVKPGGRLVYITCSLFPAENTAQLAAFRERHAGFGALDAQELVARRHPPLAGKVTSDGAGGILLSPGRTGTDGFFIAVLEKSA